MSYKLIVKNYMKVGIKKVLTEAISTKVPSTVGSVVGTSMIASGLFELTKEGTKAIISTNTEETPSALEVENALLKSEIITLKNQIAILEEPSIGSRIDEAICTIHGSMTSWFDWATKRPQPKIEKPPLLPKEKTSAVPTEDIMEEHLAFSLVPEGSGVIFRVFYLIFGLYMIYYPLFHSLFGKLFSKK